jgi:hypothetical protein
MCGNGLFLVLTSLLWHVGLTEEKPDFVYSVIETLLPNAVYNVETGRGKLLELYV